MTDAASALKIETDFLSGVEANFEAAKGKQFRGTIWKKQHGDESDRVRALMAANRQFDREVLKSIPANRRVVLQGYERRFIFGKRRTGVASAIVISPISHYAANRGGGAPPIGLGELMDHVRKQIVDPNVPHVIGVCSPSGFAPEARQARLELPNVTVLLVEPAGDGGFRVVGGVEGVDPRLLRIFDPESTNQKLERVQRFAAEHSADLLTGGLSVASAAARLELPEDVVQKGFEKAAISDPELKVGRKDGEFLLFRGAPVVPSERKSMNVIERIKQLFSGEADASQKINLLAERRAALAQRRDRIYEDIGKLEHKEADLLNQGKSASSQIVKRRLAAQLAQLRKDTARQNTTAAMLNQQINIISTDIHNLTLIQQGELAQLPSTTELTENAVRAEELLESLRADSDLVSGLETGLEASLTNDEELEILKEFEAEAKPAQSPPMAAPPQRSAGAKPAMPSPIKESPTPPMREGDSRRAGPEAT